MIAPALVDNQAGEVSMGLRSSDYNGLDFIGQRVELTEYQLPKSYTLSFWISSYRDGIIFKGNGITMTAVGNKIKTTIDISGSGGIGDRSWYYLRN